jgi:tRNA A-37 threonylcarbamoyl transferase component Bud32
MERIGKFDIIELLGRGAMGMVYKGTDPALARHVAVKVMTAHLEMDPELRARFFREAQAAGSLQHPNIVTVYELGDAAGKPYIAMEFVPGRDLDDIIGAREPLTIVEKVDIIEQVCRGLAYAHERQIIHRDVKPANIRVTEMGQVKLMDFGVAHLISSELTQTGSVMGTPYYMAPEVVNGQAVDARADIFSLGATFYELLSYSRPFQGESLQTVFSKILHSDPPPLRELGLDVPPVIQKVLDRALAKSPRDRYSDTGEFLNDLMRFWETVPAAAQARSASTTALQATVAKTAGKAKSRRRWRSKRLIPLALGTAVVIAGLVVVGGAVVWPMVFGADRLPAERLASIEEPSAPGGGAADPQPVLVAQPTDSMEASRDSAVEQTVPEDTGVEDQSAASKTTATPEPAARQTQPRQPSRPTVDRGPYDTAHQAADRARDGAVDVDAPRMAALLFQQAESLREQSIDAAGNGRYEVAARQMRQAVGLYADARSEAIAGWEARLDSAWTELGALREAADSEAASFARAEQLWRQVESAEGATDYAVALNYASRAAEAYRSAERPAVSEAVAEEPDPIPRRSAEDVVTETLGRLRQAIESEDMAALQRVWVGLSSDELDKFQDSFDLMSGLEVRFDVLSLEDLGNRVRATIETTYEFQNEASRRRETSTFRQVLELAERDDRWVIVGSRG